MLTEMIQCRHKIKEEVKAIQSELKKNMQGTKMKGRKLGFKSMIWNIRKQKTNQNNKKKIEYKKNEDSIRSLWDISKHTDIIGVPEGEEEEQEIENLFEKIMKENFPNLVKEINMQV